MNENLVIRLESFCSRVGNPKIRLFPMLPIILAWLLAAGCSDSIDGAGGATIVPGTYNLEYILVSGDCESSLAQVIDSVDGVPQVQGFPVGTMATHIGEFWTSFVIQDIRHPFIYPWVHFEHGPEGRWEQNRYPTIIWPDPEDDSHPVLDFAPRRKEIDAHFPEPGKIILEVTSTWGDRIQRDYPEVQNGTDVFVPERACVESYRVVMTVDEPCLPYESCTSTPAYSTIIRGPGGYRYSLQRLICNCSDPADGWPVEEDS